MQKSYAHNTLEAAVERNISCSDGMHQVISNKFTREDYAEINDRADMKLERYQELQKSLNELRSLNSTRYLYTAKRDADGRFIYLVDGLDLLAEDFAYPGTYIEEEMIPYISAALDGETIYSQEIMDTTWGHIFTACYLVRATDGSHEIIGALCVEMDMESSYAWIETSNRRALGFAVMAVLVAVLLIAWISRYTRAQKKKEREQQRLLEESAAAAEAAKARRASVPLDKTNLAGKRILLAEDNDLNAEIARELLGEEGLVVERADNGVACVELLEKAPAGYYDLILMDVQMPVMNGYEATGKIRKLQDKSKAQIPIIAMTANAFAEDRQKALSVGMNDHVAKPIDMNTLIPVLQKYLQAKR